jgi:hypothetical protein
MLNKKTNIDNKNVQISKQSNDMYSERENVDRGNKKNRRSENKNYHMKLLLQLVVLSL